MHVAPLVAGVALLVGSPIWLGFPDVLVQWQHPRDTERLAILFLRAVYGPEFELHDPTHPIPRDPTVVPLFDYCLDVKRLRVQQNCVGESCDIVFVGDAFLEALTGVWCYNDTSIPHMAKALGDFKYESLVVAGAGDETQNTLFVLDRVLLKLKSPKVFVVMLGLNNIEKSLHTAASATEGVKRVVSKLRMTNSMTKIFVHALPPPAEPDFFGRRGFNSSVKHVWAETNSELRKFALKFTPAIKYIDCFKGYLHVMETASRSSLGADAPHVDQDRYGTWLKCLEPIVDKALIKKEVEEGSPCAGSRPERATQNRAETNQ